MANRIGTPLFKVGIAFTVVGLSLVFFGPKAAAFFASLAVFCVSIFIHEYGHYVLMVRNGVTVTQFSVGLGPTLWERKLKSGTMFRLRMLPLGGFAMPVMGDNPGSMDKASYWAKFRIYMAGMFFNATATFIALLVMFVGFNVTPGLFVPLVKVTEIWFGDLSPVSIAFLLSYGLWLATPYFFFLFMSVGLVDFLSMMSGPMGLVSVGVQTASSSVVGHGTFTSAVLMLIGYFAMLNVSIAGFNLLPLMPLDGGQVVRITLEKIPGRIGKAVVQGYTIIATALILLFIAVVLCLDFFKLMTGNL